MANSYVLSYSAEQIDEKLGKVDKAILSIPHFLTSAQQAQARANINVQTITYNASGTFIDVNDVSNDLLKTLTIYGKTTLTGTGFVSSGDNGSITIGVTGKNIFGGEALANRIVEICKQTTDQATIGEDSTGRYVTFKGSSVTGKVIFDAFKPSKSYKVVLYGRSTGNRSCLRYSYDGIVKTVTGILTSNGETTFSTPTGNNVDRLYGYNDGGWVTLYYDKCGIFERLEYEQTNIFEEFKGQIFTISTTNNLRGLETACDEIDLTQGKIIHRIGVIESYNGEEITTEYMSSTGALDVGATVLYVLDEPETEDISTEEMAVYKSVCTVKPYTKIFNNAKANMDVKYVIDTKTYIDKKALETILHGKTAVFDGDSICEGSSAGDYLSGWAGRIGTKNSMVWKNYAVGGGTIVNTSGKYCIGANIDTIHSQYPNLDYLILEGGTNDADSIGAAGLGEFSEYDYDGSYDTTTFSGAFETLLYKAVTYYPSAKIGYIVPHKMIDASSIRRTYFDRAIELCKKWGVPYIDLWSIAHLNRHLTAHYDSSLDEQGNIDAGKLFVDTQHLSPSGYEVITPKIEAWMETL